MSLTAGIVGLPNVGKSTLFNAITKSKALSANYPFATIEPNVGIVEINDERLNHIVEVVNPKRVVYNTVSFTDIAGLVKGASRGEGLGNQFLSHIRDCDAICQVVRCFEDGDIIHVNGKVDPIDDIETINLELILADLAVIENRLPKIEKKAKTKVDKESVMEYDILTRIKEALENEKLASSVSLEVEERTFIKNYNFLTLKPMIYVLNVGEDELNEDNEYVLKVKEYAAKSGSETVKICAKIEEELTDLDDEEKAMFLEELGISESGLDKLVKKTYSLLGLATYFTAGEQECRAWTFKRGMKAPQCAGVIHSDFERGFIKAEVVNYSELLNAGSYVKAKELGKVRIEGKDYVVQDGDVMLFRFNV